MIIDLKNSIELMMSLLSLSVFFVFNAVVHEVRKGCFVHYKGNK